MSSQESFVVREVFFQNDPITEQKTVITMNVVERGHLSSSSKGSRGVREGKVPSLLILKSKISHFFLDESRNTMIKLLEH